jgi:hypothetical protein
MRPWSSEDSEWIASEIGRLSAADERSPLGDVQLAYSIC